jgi:poly-gamma-glutamate capsule biosynthesis protein CapA/YwtB (metallophosphatase superfamily)
VYKSLFLSFFLIVVIAGCSSTPITSAPATSTRLSPTSDPAPPTELPTVMPPPATLTPTSPPLIRLLFTGDINPGRCPAQIALINNDFTLAYQAVAEVLRAADITVGSLDGTVSNYSPPMPCADTLNLIGPARTVEGFQFAGFDAITLATNHAKDCSALGGICQNRTFRDTVNNLSTVDVLPIGVGDSLSGARRPTVITRGGVRFAFLGVSMVGWEAWASESQPGTAPISSETLPEVVASIQAARLAAEVVIVLPHWGIEYATVPTGPQLEWAQAMIAAGATLVIGNHPHVVQGIEQFPSGVVAYSLGNFVFDQNPEETRQGVVFEANFRGSTLESWQLLPLHIYKLYQPRWADPDEAKVILDRIAALSAQLPERDATPVP